MEKKIGYTQGTFDMFHIGHLNLIRNAKKHCDYLIVGVNADDLVESYKNKRPIVPLEERAEIVRAIRYVDEVIVTTTLDKKQVWEKVHFNEIYIGDDWKGNARWEKTGKEMEELGAKLVFLPYTKDTSSTMLREKLKEFQGARYEKKNKKENKKATASEKLTKVVAIRISQTDYDIFLEKAKMENPESTKINISKYLCSVLHDSTISNFHFLKKNFRQVEQALLNIDSKLLQIEKNSAGSFYPEEMLEKISECKRQLEKLEFDFQKLEEEISKWQSPN